jgi:hypothetical protein
MKEKLLKVQKIINGEKEDEFKNKCYGQYLSGDVTFTFGSESYTMTFLKGALIEVMDGVNLTGIEMGVIGPQEGWQELYAHKNFSRAIGPMHGKLRLQGNMVKCMGNLNPLGYIARVLCGVV